MAHVMDFDTKVVPLLAGYKDKNGNVHMEAEIREMTGIDEEDIQKPEVRSNMGRIISTVLRNCVVRVGDLEKTDHKAGQWEDIMKDLFLGDRDLLMKEVRQFTYGEDIEIPFKCPYCKGEGKHIMEWDELKIEPLTVDPHNVSFSLKKGAKNEKGERVTEGKLRLPIGLDQEFLDGIARKNMGQANTTLITRCVESLGDVKLSSKVFKELTSVDREAIVTIIADNSFGPSFKTEIDCPSCGERFDTGVHPVNFM
jgi:hypothetical protein